jgi:hypothetical protein
VHLPELLLPAGAFADFRGVQRVRMDLLQREVPEDEANALLEVR